MILLLDTSTADCQICFVENGASLLEDTWHADRELAEKLLSYLEEKMSSVGKSWQDLSGIGVMKGPGSFTGLRIGAAVCNAVAHDRKLPIVGESGPDWQSVALSRLENGENEQMVVPDYGRPARITTPRK